MQLFFTTKKISIFKVILIFSVALLLYSLFFQFNTFEAASESSLELVVSKVSNQVPRGLIIDTNGKVLASNEEVFDLYIPYSKSLEDDYANFIGSDVISQVDRSKIKTDIDVFNDQDLKVADGLTLQELNKVTKEHKDLIVQTRYKRIYEDPKVFGNILGYVGLPEETDLENYEPSDLVGKSKVELNYEDDLKGIKPQDLNLDGSTNTYQGMQGDTVKLTIDSEWQKSLYNLLEKYNDKNGGYGGAAVVMEANSGKIKSLVSYPGVDTNILMSKPEEVLAKIEGDPERPLVDKAIGTSLTPGSTFKIFTSYSLLKSNTIDLNSTYFSNRCMNIGTYRICEFGEFFYGSMNLSRALTKSSNLFFCNYLLEQEQNGKLIQFIDFAKSIGIGSKTGLKIDGEVSGNLDSPANKKDRLGESWFPGDTCNLSIGQGATLVTPLQMARSVATYSNGGELLKPTLVESVKSVDGKYQQQFNKSQVSSVDLESSIVENVLSAMKDVAYSNESAVSYYLKDLPNNLRIKTGTAEASEIYEGGKLEGNHSWLVGLFDHKGKTYSFSIVQLYSKGSFYTAPLLEEFLKVVNDS